MKNYCGAIWRCRYFWFSLVRMDLNHRYRGSFLGMGWSLLQPLALTTLFTVLFSSIFDLPPLFYFIYVLTGLAFWTFLHAVMIQGCKCFLQGEHYIRQHPAPLAVYPLRTVLGSAFHLSVAVIAALLLSWIIIALGSRGRPEAQPLLAALSLIPTFCLLVVFGWAVATLAGLAQVLFRDTGHLCEVGLQVLFYLTPIMYPRRLMDERGFGLLMSLNPLVPLLDALRGPLVYQTMPEAMLLLKAGVIVMITLMLAVTALARLEKRLIFKL